jgi:hypothetical protein
MVGPGLADCYVQQCKQVAGSGRTPALKAHAFDDWQ